MNNDVSSAGQADEAIARLREDAASVLLAAPFATSRQVRQKGLAYLDGMIASSQILMDAERAAPRFVRISGITAGSDGGEIVRRAGLDNPDNDYWQTEIDDRSTYVVDGIRGTSRDINFQLLDGNYTERRNDMPVNLGTLTLNELLIGTDGTYQVTLGPAGAVTGHNVLELPPGARTLFFRETYSDWETEKPGAISIRAIDGPAAEQRPPMNHPEATKRLEEILHNRLALWLQFGPGTAATVPQASVLGELPINQLFGPLATNGGLPDQLSASGRFTLGPEEVIVVTTAADAAPYQGIQLGDDWFTSLEFLDAMTSLSGNQATRDADGRFRFVIAHTDPAIANWLDTTGLESFFVFMRWQGLNPEAPTLPAPGVAFVKLDDLFDVLPPDTTRVSTEERKAQLLRRRAAWERREIARGATRG